MIAIGPHDETTDDVYATLLDALELEVSAEERQKPPCCDDEAKRRSTRKSRRSSPRPSTGWHGVHGEADCRALGVAAHDVASPRRSPIAHFGLRHNGPSWKRSFSSGDMARRGRSRRPRASTKWLLRCLRSGLSIGHAGRRQFSLSSPGQALATSVPTASPSSRSAPLRPDPSLRLVVARRLREGRRRLGLSRRVRHGVQEGRERALGGRARRALHSTRRADGFDHR